MSFSFPQFLWAFTALLIPVLIHLFNLRRPKVLYFSNTKLLKNLELNTRASRRLKHWLVLSLRLLALSALILAFAQPEFKTESVAAKKQNFALYLDNSYSLQKSAIGGDGLSLVKNRAAELLQSLDPHAKVRLYNNDADASALLSPTEALNELEKLDYSAAYSRLNDLVLRMARENKEAAFFLFSDFQKSSLPRPDETWPDSLNAFFVPIPHLDTFQIAAIDSLWLKSPYQNANFVQELGLRIRAFGAQKLKLKLYLNDTLNAQKEFETAGKDLVEIDFPFRMSPAKLSRAKMELSRNDEPLDQFFFSLRPSKKARVLHLSPQGNSWLDLSLFQNTYFDLKQNNLAQVDYSFLAQAELIILEGTGPLEEGLKNQLQGHLAAGKNLLLIPGESALDFQSLAQQFELQLAGEWLEDSLPGTKLMSQDPYFAGVFENQPRYPILPFSRKVIPLQKGQSVLPLINLSGDIPAVLRKPSGGDLFIWLFSLEKRMGNFLSHKLIRPLLLNPALFQGAAQKVFLYDDFQSYQDVPLDGNYPGNLSIALGDQYLIPPQQKEAEKVKIKFPPSSLSSGQFPLLLKQDTLDYLSLNLHPQEKLGICLNEDQLQEHFRQEIKIWQNEQSFKTSLFNPKEAYDLWWYFIIAAIFFALVEIIVLKRLKQ